jgi:acetyl-CoA C-acetyltransferase
MSGQFPALAGIMLAVPLSKQQPVLVGAFERTDRAAAPEEKLSPLQALEAVVRGAVADSGAPSLLERAQVVAVVDGFSWPVPDPGAALAAELGIAPSETWRSARGGTGPLALLQEASAAIARGELDVALIAGAEAMTPYMRAVKAGESAGWPEQPDGTQPARVVGVDRDASHPAESAAGLIAPIFYYPLIEHAHRAVAGRGVREHADWIGSWWAPYSEVAAANEHAWSRSVLTPEQVATPSPDNRLVSSPYTKVMNANIQVDQAAALVLCSAEAAEAAGVPRDRWVFVEATAGGHDHWFVGERPELHRSPALAASLRHAVRGGDIDVMDLYSCFPSAVQTAALELGMTLGDGAPPTVTGGLAFFGGPANDYVTHSVAALVRRLREADGPARGLATAVGWYLTKHHAATLSNRPPDGGYAAADVQDEVDAQPRVTIAEGWSGEAPSSPTPRSTTATAPRRWASSPSARPTAARAFAKSHDPDTCAELTGTEDPVGRTARLDGEAGFTL